MATTVSNPISDENIIKSKALEIDDENAVCRATSLDTVMECGKDCLIFNVIWKRKDVFWMIYVIAYFLTFGFLALHLFAGIPCKSELSVANSFEYLIVMGYFFQITVEGITCLRYMYFIGFDMSNMWSWRRSFKYSFVPLLFYGIAVVVAKYGDLDACMGNVGPQGVLLIILTTMQSFATERCTRIVSSLFKKMDFRSTMGEFGDVEAAITKENALAHLTDSWDVLKYHNQYLVVKCGASALLAGLNFIFGFTYLGLMRHDKASLTPLALMIISSSVQLQVLATNQLSKFNESVEIVVKIFLLKLGLEIKVMNVVFGKDWFIGFCIPSCLILVDIAVIAIGSLIAPTHH